MSYNKENFSKNIKNIVKYIKIKMKTRVNTDILLINTTTIFQNNLLDENIEELNKYFESTFMKEEKILLRNLCYLFSIDLPDFIMLSNIKKFTQNNVPTYEKGKTFFKETVWKLDEKEDPYIRMPDYYYLQHFFDEYESLLETYKSYDFYYINLINMSQIIVIFFYEFNQKTMSEENKTIYTSKMNDIIIKLLIALESCHLIDIYKVYFLYLDLVTLKNPINRFFKSLTKKNENVAKNDFIMSMKIVKSITEMNVNKNQIILKLKYYPILLFTFNHFKPHIYGRAEACKIFVTNINPYLSIHEGSFSNVHNKICHNSQHFAYNRSLAISNKSPLQEYKDILNEIYSIFDFIPEIEREKSKKICISFIHFIIHEAAHKSILHFSLKEIFKNSYLLFYHGNVFEYLLHEFMIDISFILYPKTNTEILSEIKENEKIDNFIKRKIPYFINLYQDIYILKSITQLFLYFSLKAKKLREQNGYYIQTCLLLLKTFQNVNDKNIIHGTFSRIFVCKKTKIKKNQNDLFYKYIFIDSKTLIDHITVGIKSIGNISIGNIFNDSKKSGSRQIVVERPFFYTYLDNKIKELFSLYDIRITDEEIYKKIKEFFCIVLQFLINNKIIQNNSFNEIIVWTPNLVLTIKNYEIFFTGESKIENLNTTYLLFAERILFHIRFIIFNNNLFKEFSNKLFKEFNDHFKSYKLLHPSY
jgi:hypothetical protein